MPDPVQPEPRPPLEADRRFIELGQSLWNDNTEKGRAFRAAAKEKFPDAVTIEDQLDPIIAPLREEARKLGEELAAERALRAKEREDAAKAAAEQRLTNSLDEATRHFRLTEAGRDLMIKRMEETSNFTDPLAAAAWVVSANPPPKDPTGYLGPQAINLFGSAQESAEERIQLLHADPMGKFLDAEFTDFIRDPDQYIRDAGFAA